MRKKKGSEMLSHLTTVTQLIWWEVRIILSSSVIIYSPLYHGIDGNLMKGMEKKMSI